MIRRIDEAYLDLRNDKWYFDKSSKENGFLETDILFSGLILFPDGGAINEVPYRNKIKICKDGVIVGDYKVHPYISKIADYENCIQTFWGNLDIGREWEADTYEEKPFTGVSYLDREDKDDLSYISEEILYIDGTPRATLKYFEDGSLKSLNFQNYFKLTCSEPNTLSFLSIDKDYFTKYPKLEQSSLEKDVIEDASSFRRFKANQRLSFSGGGVNDEVFDALWGNKGMEKVEELSFRYPSLTNSSYYTLLNLPKLSDLNIEIDIDMMSDLADTIKFIAKELKAKKVKVSLRMNKKMIEV
jgi:hypothetical protein